MSKRVLDLLTTEGYHPSYIGVDASKEMIKENKNEFSDTPFTTYFMNIDFTDSNFREALQKNLPTQDSPIIFSMFGATAGNFTISELKRRLKSIMRKGDIFWHDIVISEENTPFQHQDYYSSLCDNKSASQCH